MRLHSGGGETTKAEHPFQRMHMDAKTMEEIPGVAQGFIVIVDKHSHMLGAKTVKSNLEAIECLTAFKRLHAWHARDRTAFERSDITVITDGGRDTFPESAPGKCCCVLRLFVCINCLMVVPFVDCAMDYCLFG